MNLDIVSKLIRMMEDSRLTTLEVEQNGLRVRMENSANASGFLPPPSRNSEVFEAPSPVVEEKDQPAEQEPSQDDDNKPVGRHEIKSPMVGSFHEIKGVGIGSSLKKGDVVCVIEAMKVMNEILMESDGVITWKALNEGDMAEFGQILFMYD